MRSLGEFFGEVAKGLRAKPGNPRKDENDSDRPRGTVLRQEVQERETTTPDGRRVVLRRTTTEEIEIRPETPDPPRGE